MSALAPALLPPEPWRPYFDLTATVRALAAGGSWPVPAKVFAAFELVRPEDVRVVVVGQDPYPDARAQGLSFSAPRGEVPPSLANITRAVLGAHLPDPGDTAAREELTRQLMGREVRPQLDDLRFWAAQGVLLLNRALTCRRSTKDNLAAWRVVTNGVIARLCEARADDKLVFLLWGKVAQEVCVPPPHVALCWTHPSPAADNCFPPPVRFCACPHFRQANALLAAAGWREVVWLEGKTLAAFDGGCSGNGTAGALAGYGACFTRGALAGLRVAGPVLPCAYALIDPADPLAGFCPVLPAAAARALPADDPQRVAPTNNRGEFLGCCHLLLEVARAGLSQPVHIITDSALVRQTLEEWAPAWERQGKIDSKKNPDLVRVALGLLRALRAQSVVSLIQLPWKSHTGWDKALAVATRKGLRPATAAAYWEANGLADGLAARGAAEAEKRRWFEGDGPQKEAPPAGQA